MSKYRLNFDDRLCRGSVSGPFWGTVAQLVGIKIRVSFRLVPDRHVYRVQCLRDLHKFFGITFKIQPDEETDTVLLTCVGVGYTNIGRKAT